MEELIKAVAVPLVGIVVTIVGLFGWLLKKVMEDNSNREASFQKLLKESAQREANYQKVINDQSDLLTKLATNYGELRELFMDYLKAFQKKGVT